MYKFSTCLLSINTSILVIYYTHVVNAMCQCCMRCSGIRSTGSQLRSGSVVVERSPGMWEVGGSIPGHVKQKTLKFEVLLLCLALSTKELETFWPARSQNNGLGWDITAYPWGGVSVGQYYKDWPQVGLVQDGSSTSTPTCSR